MTDEGGLQQHVVHISFQNKRVIMGKHKKDDVHINAFLYKRSGLNIYLYTGNKCLE
jgi:hypothetical protein